MAKKTKKYKVRYSRFMAFVVLVVACVVLLFLIGGQNKLKNIEVECADQALSSEQKAEIIRASTLKMGAQIDSIADLTGNVEMGVNSTGFARFEDIERVSNGTLRLTVSVRKPIAVIAGGGNYIQIDQEGMVMSVSSQMPSNELVYVTGADVSNYYKGKTIVLRKENQLKDIIRIASAIQSLGYQSTYSELNVKDLKDIYLVTNTNQIIEIFDGKNIDKTLRMVEEIIKSGGVKGKITISGDYAGYRKEE